MNMSRGQGIDPQSFTGERGNIMKKILIVVDMQKDFVDGALGTKESAAIVDNVVDKINSHSGLIFATYDTHFENYLETNEGRNLPVPHCIKGSDGWQLNSKVEAALKNKDFTAVEKITFGSVNLPNEIKKVCGDEDFEIERVGLCTDICVISNALILKANFPEAKISVDSACCAGVTPETHNAALAAMKCCQINVIGA